MNSRPFDYDPPVVKWVADGDGHHPEPPPDPGLTQLNSLRYDAALVKARCGVDCRIGQVNGPNAYDYVVFDQNGAWISSGCCGTSYWQAREFLQGMEIGVRAGHAGYLHRLNAALSRPI